MDHKSQAVLKLYCHEVCKHLVCKKSTKRRLLSALREELADAAQGCSSYEALVAQIGMPPETAKQLQDSVSDREYAEVLRCARRNRYVVIPAIILLSLLLIAAAATYAYRVWNAVPVYYTETIGEGASGLPDCIWGGITAKSQQD